MGVQGAAGFLLEPLPLDSSCCAPEILMILPYFSSWPAMSEQNNCGLGLPFFTLCYKKLNKFTLKVDLFRIILMMTFIYTVLIPDSLHQFNFLLGRRPAKKRMEKAVNNSDKKDDNYRTRGWLHNKVALSSSILYGQEFSLAK